MQQIKADLDTCYAETGMQKPAAGLTFLQLVDLLQPLRTLMQFAKAQRAEYRVDTVLGVQGHTGSKGVQATHVAARRFKVSGVHFQISDKSGEPHDSLPVEVTLEADDEAKAHAWVG
jgi:hypothetical protein